MRFHLSSTCLILAFIGTTILAGQNHLNPVRPCTGDYDKAVLQSLVPENGARLWMIAKPSFRPEYAIILMKNEQWDDSDPDVENWELTNTIYSVVQVIAEEKIWKSKRLADGLCVLDISSTNRVIRHQVDISKEFAKQMEAAWLCVLKQTRYPDQETIGLDGTTFQFFCHYEYFGEIWSPDSGPPAMLSDLGKELGKLAVSTNEENNELISTCYELASNIITKTKSPNQSIEAIVTTPVD